MFAKIMRMAVMPNTRDEWRRAGGVQRATETRSRRRLQHACWAARSWFECVLPGYQNLCVPGPIREVIVQELDCSSHSWSGIHPHGNLSVFVCLGRNGRRPKCSKKHGLNLGELIPNQVNLYSVLVGLVSPFALHARETTGLERTRTV